MPGRATGHVFIATSLDGFIADEAGGIDWLTSRDPGAEDMGYAAFIAGMDAIVMGRCTFQTVRDFDPWPYNLPVTVLSRSLTTADLPARLRDKVTLSAAPLPQVFTDLATRGHRNIYVDGGAVIRSALAAGLIRHITLTIAPVLLGRGRPLFGQTPAALTLTGARSFASGFTQATYSLG